MFRLSRKACLWIAIAHTLVVMPSFLKTHGGEFGPAWVWTVLFFDTPLFVPLVVIPSMPAGREILLHHWIAAPLVFLLGPMYWIMLFAIIRQIVNRLDKAGTEAINQRIRNREAKRRA